MTSQPATATTSFKTSSKLLSRAAFRRPSPYLLLFIILLGVYAYTPPRWQDWNQNSRFNLTRALVEDQSVRIDKYAWNTGDYAEIDGRIYSDKAPGLSFLAVPGHVAVQVLSETPIWSVVYDIGESGGFQGTLNAEGAGLNEDRIDVMLSLYLATLLTVTIPAAGMLVLLAIIAERLTGERMLAILSVLLIGLATPVFTYSQAFYGHIPAAACLVGALTLLILRGDGEISRRRILAIGALLAWAVVIELPAAVIGLPIALWLLYAARQRAVIYGLVGAIPPLVLLAVYDLIAFGSLLPVGYKHSALWQDQHSTGFMSLTYPHLDALWGLSFSPFRGLFFYSPVLLLAVLGFIPLYQRHRAIALVIGGGSVLFFLFISSSIMWWGGFSVGPRYLVPVIPLLAIPLAFGIREIRGLRLRNGRLGVLAMVVLTAISTTLIWAGTVAGQAYPPDTTRRPLTDYILPLLQDGDVARNLGMALQLEGLMSLIPLAVLLAASLLLLRTAMRRDRVQV